MKNLKKLLTITAVVLMTALLACTAFASDAIKGDLLYENDLSEVPAGYATGTAEWTVNDGVLQVKAADGLGDAWYTIDGTSDYADKVVISVDMAINTGVPGNAAGVSARCVDAPSGHSYDAIIGLESDANIAIRPYAVLGINKEFKPALNTWYNVTYALNGTQLVMYVDGTLYVDTANDSYDSGSISLFAWQSNSSYKNLKVYALNEEALAADVQAYYDAIAAAEAAALAAKEAAKIANAVIPYGEVLYENALTDVPEGVQTGSGIWYADNNKTTLVTGADAWLILDGVEYDDNFIVSVDIERMPDAGSGSIGLSIRKNPDDPANTGYDFDWYMNGEIHSMQRPYIGALTNDAGYEHEAETVHTYTVVVQGTSYKIYFDGEYINTLEHDLYTSGGNLGLFSWNSAGRFSNLKVYSIAAAEEPVVEEPVVEEPVVEEPVVEEPVVEEPVVEEVVVEAPVVEEVVETPAAPAAPQTADPVLMLVIGTVMTLGCAWGIKRR